MLKVENLSGEVIGPYQLRERLGTGAMSSVYLAYHPQLNQYVAIKILKDTGGQDQQISLQRFLLEAKTIATLKHPNIVPFYDFGVDKGVSYLVMRWLPGGTLDDRLNARLQNGGPLPSLGEISLLLQQLARALDYAHQHGVIHRDVKASNILFDDEGWAYLADFGVVKLMHTDLSLTQPEIVLGTPDYMPPEQWRGDPLSQETDQYALGILIYLLTTGRLPFNATIVEALSHQHLQEVPQPAHQFRPEIPEKLSDVIGRAMAKDTRQRYLTNSAFAETFAGVIQGFEGEPTQFFTFPLPAYVRAAQHPSSLTPISTPSATASRLISSKPRKSLLSSVLQIGIGIIVISLIAVGLLVNFMGSRQEASQTSEQLASATSIVIETLSANPQRTSIPEAVNSLQLSTVVALTPLPRFELLTVTPQVVSQSASNAGENTISPLMITSANASQVQARSTIPSGSSSVRSVALTSDGRFLSVANASYDIEVWDIENNSRVLALPGNTDTVLSLAFSPDGTRLASGSTDGTVRVWDTSTGQQIYVLPAHLGEVRQVAFNHSGTLLASAGADQIVRLWDVATGAMVNQLQGHTDRVLCIAFTPDDALLVSGSADARLIAWNVATGTPFMTFVGHQGEVRSIAIHPEGNVIASASTDNTLRLWSVQTGAGIMTLAEQPREIETVVFSPDGSVLASGGRDNLVYLWDAQTGALLTQLDGHSGWVFDVQFSDDGELLASASGDGTVRLWSISAGSNITSMPIPVSQSDEFPPIDRSRAPDGSELLNGGRGLTDGTTQNNGELQVEGYCRNLGYGTNHDSNNWYCTNNGVNALQLEIADFDRICQQTYNNAEAFAIQDGNSYVPSFNWHCYAPG